MANWAYKVNFKDFYHKYPEEISLQDVAKGGVEKLNELLVEIRKEPKVDLSIHYVYRDEFMELAEDEFLGEDEFDNVMSELYDWADTSLDNNFGGVKMCWVNTL